MIWIIKRFCNTLEFSVYLQVEAVPTVLGVKDGKVVEKFVGLKDDAAIESFLDKLAPQWIGF